jgi:hypothetical protein
VKKKDKLKAWLKARHESSIDTQDYTREMVLREVIKKVEEIYK